MQELILKVIDWAEARNIIEGSRPEKQLEKTAAELVELAIAVGQDSLAAELNLGGERFAREVSSELGDIVVTLIIVSKQLGFEFEDCLEIAYDKIKNRKGKMVDGKFVKEEDL